MQNKQRTYFDGLKYYKKAEKNFDISNCNEERHRNVFLTLFFYCNLIRKINRTENDYRSKGSNHLGEIYWFQLEQKKKLLHQRM